MFTQITIHEGVVKRVPNGDRPVVELDLEPGAYVAGMEIRSNAFDHPERKTADWYWRAVVVHPLHTIDLAPQVETLLRAIDEIVPQRYEDMHPNLIALYDQAQSMRNVLEVYRGG